MVDGGSATEPGLSGPELAPAGPELVRGDLRHDRFLLRLDPAGDDRGRPIQCGQSGQAAL
ncbi:hypothetical protein ACFFX0_32650 [Citricoccus parietis]|uniref:Uncharacterized protein n=1 Tax=Citricoccus parietis TaxID=592307 RepID=A0ABV5G9P9_9MICC